jgi:hypothetical protein
MLIELSPLVFNILFGCLFAGIGGMIGYNLSNNRREEIIEDTIIYLVENNYVKSKKIDGELELLKLNGEE